VQYAHISLSRIRQQSHTSVTGAAPEKSRICWAAVYLTCQPTAGLAAHEPCFSHVTSSRLQAWSEADMRHSLGFPADLAAKLHQWARGRDDAPVAERPPPKTLSVQVTFWFMLILLSAPCIRKAQVQAANLLLCAVGVVQWQWQNLHNFALTLSRGAGRQATEQPLINLQMSLTPDALPMHPSQIGQPTVAGDRPGEPAVQAAAMNPTLGGIDITPCIFRQ